jgi:hypothetical protein
LRSWPQRLLWLLLLLLPPLLFVAHHRPRMLHEEARAAPKIVEVVTDPGHHLLLALSVPREGRPNLVNYWRFQHPV